MPPAVTPRTLAAPAAPPARWLWPSAILRLAAPDAACLRRSFALACAAVLVLLSALSLVRHHTYHSSLYDLGIFHQVLWNTAHGRPFASSIKHMSYLGDHFSPSFALLAPIEYLPGALDLLLILQAAAPALCAWNLFRLASRHLEGRAAWLVGMGTLVSPLLFCPVLADIHPEPFMAVLLSQALLLLDEGALGGAGLCLGLSLLGKEDAGLLLAPLGVVMAMVAPRDERRARTVAFGLAVAAVSLCWSAAAMAVFMPRFRPPVAEAGWFYLGRLAHLGATPSDIARTLLLHPAWALFASTTPPKLLTVLALLCPFALAPLRSLRLLSVVPFAAAHYLSGRTTEFWFPFHYLTPTVPLIAWAAIAGAPGSWLAPRDSRRPRLAAALLFASALLAVGYRLDPGPLAPRRSQAALSAAIALVPPTEPVCVENWFGAHLAARQSIEFCVLWEWEREQYRHYGWPEFSSARYQLFDLDDPERDHPGLAGRLSALRAAGADMLFDQGGVTLLRVDQPVLARAAALTPPTPPPPPTGFR